MARWVLPVCLFAGTITAVMLPLNTLHAQEAAKKTITGKVTDDAGKPLQGVTVGAKGTGNQTTTDANGLYVLKNLTGTETIAFSFVGFTAREAAVGSNTELNMSLVPDVGALTDVVVVGYGSRKRTEVTGATSSVTGEKLRNVQTANLTQALQGQIPGVLVTANTFRPGAGSTIRIRGNRSLSASNEPLFVVDGFPVSYTIDDMNPADIETVDVLKDAAATAIYGVRGANGVVQITTRKGKAGKTAVSYQGSRSWDEIIRPLPVFNGPEIADAWRQAFFADRSYTNTRAVATVSNPLYYYPTASADIALFWTRFGSLEQWNSIKDAYQWRVYDPATNTFIAAKRATTSAERDLMAALGVTSQLDSVDIYDPSKVKSYDWLNEVGLRTGSTDNHNVSVTGGTEKLKASLNLGYFKQRGIEYAQDYTRYTAGTSVDFKPVKFINFGTTINYTHAITNSSTSSYANASGMIPLVQPYDSNGNWMMFPNQDRQVINAINDRHTVFDETTADRVFGNIFAEFTLYKGLKFKTMYGLDRRTSVRGQFNGAQSSIRLGSAANATQTTNEATSWVWDNILTYNTRIKEDHSINVTLLQELQSLNRSSSLTMSANNLIFEQQKWYSLQRNTDATVTGSGTYSASQYLSYMGRIEYGFKSKYLLTLSTRYDNSSVLAEGSKGAYFPAASVAWQIDRENFFTGQSLFTSARLRAGYGEVGNASIAPYQTAGPLGFTNYNWGNGTAAIGTAPTTFKTPNLSWEKTATTNIGLEFAMLKNRISGTIDVYKSKTTDQLQNRSIPAANGVTSVYFNLGRVDNKGIEIALTTQNMIKPNFRWSTDWMFSANKEEIVDIDGSGNSNYANLWILGQPLQVYWSYKKDGIFQYGDTAAGKGSLPTVYWVKNGRTNVNYQPGRIKIVDTNGDSSFSPSDKVVLGSHNPRFIASLTNTLTYKNWELNFMFYFRAGGLYRVPRPGLVGRYQSPKVNYWTPSNPSNEYQQPTQTSDIPSFWEGLTYREATHVRLRNVTLTYKLPKNISQKMFMNNLAFYVSAVNPILWHSASDYDPETAPYREFAGNTTNQVGPTSYSYKSWIVGVRVDL
jgi:TonB-linked SusC/RagA family outer membrane protein